ncbi:tetratricopeptide repeat protein [Skeletonema marinoi]|uniref:Tetratricopeptide repeat protein n=2 Tax=Skeletonema marinoi TaxID=267567 RepID=A0AAD8XW86_9STRA|nr:tetratricopeptide repeat protein [Skeletonema marinoi]
MMTMSAAVPQVHNGNDSDSDDSDVAFAYLDFGGVDFGEDGEEVKEESNPSKISDADKPTREDIAAANAAANAPAVVEQVANLDLNASESDATNSASDDLPTASTAQNNQGSQADNITLIPSRFKSDQLLLDIEKERLLPHPLSGKQEPVDVVFGDDCSELNNVKSLFNLLENGQYADMLRSQIALDLFGTEIDGSDELSMVEQIKSKILAYFAVKATSESAIAKRRSGAHPLDGINPHGMFESLAKKENEKAPSTFVSPLPLSASTPIPEEDESAPEGDNVPSNQATETVIVPLKETNTTNYFHNAVLSELAADGEWPFQVCAAPYFLLLARSILSTLAEPTTKPSGNLVDALTGANESSASMFAAGATIVAHRRLISTRRDDDDGEACPTLWNEAERTFSRCINDFCDNETAFKDSERNAFVASAIMLEWGLAQHHFRKVVEAKLPSIRHWSIQSLNRWQRYRRKNKAHVEKQMIKHDDVSDDALLLEKIRFENADDNVHFNLSIHDQSILLALCLDVKNDNPMDGLTGMQMFAYLARVLNQHDDWMVIGRSTFEPSNLTQSTFKSVEEDSAPAQDRLRHLHGIVYPPRWDMLRDLAERYAKLGIVTSAAELFEEIELWDDVVECYRIAGKSNKAEEVVRARLAEKETPSMYAALGDITNDPKCFERSLELSHGKYYDSHVALGKYYFDKGDMKTALKYFLDGLEIKPLLPAVWFRVGTISMQLKEWDTALKAFTEVVQQEPEEGDAWANVAAIHIHRRNSAEAYPALLESLKQNRNNWRVWHSKLYTCIDLKKYDEAIQACVELINLKARRNAKEGVEPLEEKCVRAIVGGTVRKYQEAREAKDEIGIDSSKRTLVRVRELLDKIESSTKIEPWFYELSAHFNDELGWEEECFNDLMKEYRTLNSAKGWEEDSVKVGKMVTLMRDISKHHKKIGTKESLTKAKFLLNGVVKKVRSAYNYTEPSKEAEELDALLLEVKQLLE